MFEETHLMLNTESVLTNPSKLRIYPCKIPTVITETLIVLTRIHAPLEKTGISW